MCILRILVAAISWIAALGGAAAGDAEPFQNGGLEISGGEGKPFLGWTAYRWEGDGTVTRTEAVKYEGKFSARIEGTGPGKIGLFQAVTLEACSYRLSAMAAGSELVPGTWQMSAHLVVALGDGANLQFPVLTGDTGWRPMELTFSVAAKQSVTIYFFNYGAGSFFVDDVRLSRDPSCAPSQPQFSIGRDAAALNFRPPLKDEDRLLAGYCRRADFASRPVCERLRDGDPAPVRPAHSEGSLVIADFERRNPFGTPSLFGSNIWQMGRAPSSDRPAARLQGTASLNAVTGGDLPSDWSGYDWLDIDVENDSGQLLTVAIEIRDDKTTDYWSRVNWEASVAPGRSAIHVPLRVFVGEKSVVKERRRLDTSQIRRLVISKTSPGGSLFVGQVGLSAEAPIVRDFPELIALDAGPPSGPVMKGFLPLLPGSRYRPARGYGFSADARIARVEDRRHPDDLFRDWISLTKGGLDFDLPNGTYHVWMMIEDPGYWEYYPNFTRRVVTAEGQTVLDESQTSAQFLAKYFAHANDEDLPGDDIWKRYVQSRYKPLRFSVTVADGQLNIRFDAEHNPFAIALSALIIYPDSEAARGEAFIADLWARLKANFDREYSQALPVAPVHAMPAGNAAGGKLLVFTRPIDNDVNASDFPSAAEMTSRLSLSLAQGERGVIPVSLYAGQDTVLTGATLDLPGLEVTALLVRYKLSRANQDGTAYWNKPRVLDPLEVSPDRPLALPAHRARSLWFDIGAAATMPAGTVSGRLRLEFLDGTSHEVAVSVTVQPWQLPKADIPIGYLGVAPTYPQTVFPDIAARQAREMADAIKILDRHGMTAVTGGLGGPVVSAGPTGGVRIDFTQFDRSLAAIVDVYRSHDLNSYGGLSIAGLPADPAADLRAAFKETYAGVLGETLSAIRVHNEQRGWPSMVHAIGDEPSGPDIDRVAALGRLYRQAGARTAAFTSIRDASRDPAAKLAGAIDRLYLTLHSESAVRYVLDQGSECSLYNQSGRFRRGVYLMKMKRLGCRGHLLFALSSVHADPWYDLDGRESDISALLTHPDGRLRMSVDFLRYRQAVNDYRCLLMVEQTVARRPGHPYARLAGDWLAQSLQQMAAGSGGNEQWTNDRLGILKAACEQHLRELHGAH